MIIPHQPVSLTLSTAYGSLKLSSSSTPHHLHFQHRNTIATSPPPKPKSPLLKSDTTASDFYGCCSPQIPFFSKKILSNKEHLVRPKMH